MSDIRPAREVQLVAVDFESTGHVPGYGDQPWQLGLVPIRLGEVTADGVYETYLHIPEDRPFNPFAPGSWRAVRGQLAVAPGLTDLWPQLRSLIGGVPLVAHNTATEKKFFRKAWPLHRIGPWIDTLKLARLAYPGLSGYDLQTVVEVAGLTGHVRRLVPHREAHDALYDAMACALLLCHLMRRPGWSGLTVSELSRAASVRRRK